ncbi:MAG: HD domain-containing protein [Desulfobacteraceae bacterium]|nr:HD domain-containing protein [Desulfobacteraceae bacterium]
MPLARRIPEELTEVMGAGADRAWLVGGSVRDLLMGRTPIDYDIVVSGDFHAVAEMLARRCAARATRVQQGGRTVSRVFSGTRRWDVGPVDGGGIASDLARRDFTVNAMAYDLREGRLVDPWGGMRDLKAGLLRAVTAEALVSDPVRILRAYRIAAELDFRIEAETASDIARKAGLLRHAPGERIRTEMMALMQTPRTARHLRQMGDSGAVFSVIPALADLRRCPSAGAHDRDGWHHTVDVVGGVEQRLRDLQRAQSTEAAKAVRHFDPGRRALLKMTALLHDLGKPSARTVDAEGAVHYYGHERIGAAMAASVCRRLRFSRREQEHVVVLVRHHLRPLLLFLDGHRKTDGDRAVARLIRQMGDRFPDLALHSLADAGAKKPWRCASDQDRFDRFVGRLLAAHFHAETIPQKVPVLLNGDDLIERFGLKPSPLLRTLLEGVRDGQIAGVIRTRKQALEWVERAIRRRADGG